MDKDDEYVIPPDRFNNTTHMLRRVAEAEFSAAGPLKSTLSFLYMHEGPVNLPRERLKAAEPFLEPRELVIVRWLQTRSNGSLRSKYGAKALLAARRANYRCVTCGFSDVRALHLDHVDGHTIDTDFACLCANATT